jgi:hypothetical protein
VPADADISKHERASSPLLRSRYDSGSGPSLRLEIAWLFVPPPASGQMPRPVIPDRLNAPDGSHRPLRTDFIDGCGHNWWDAIWLRYTSDRTFGSAAAICPLNFIPKLWHATEKNLF